MLTISFVPSEAPCFDPVVVPHGITALEMLLIHHVVSHYLLSMKGSLLELEHPVSMPQIMLKPNQYREKIIVHVFNEKRIVCLT